MGQALTFFTLGPWIPGVHCRTRGCWEPLSRRSTLQDAELDKPGARMSRQVHGSPHPQLGLRGLLWVLQVMPQVTGEREDHWVSPVVDGPRAATSPSLARSGAPGGGHPPPVICVALGEPGVGDSLLTAGWKVAALSSVPAASRAWEVPMQPVLVPLRAFLSGGPPVSHCSVPLVCAGPVCAAACRG